MIGQDKNLVFNVNLSDFDDPILTHFAEIVLYEWSLILLLSC